MNNKQIVPEVIKSTNQQIEELKREMLDILSEEINNLRKELKQINNKQLETQEDDLKPGDIIEYDNELWYFSCSDETEKYFVKFKENIGKKHMHMCFSIHNYKKLSICNHKIIDEYWMATDKNGSTYRYYKFPDKFPEKLEDVEYDADYLGQNINNQTFEDDPKKIYLVEEE